MRSLYHRKRTKPAVQGILEVRPPCSLPPSPPHTWYLQLRSWNDLGKRPAGHSLILPDYGPHSEYVFYDATRYYIVAQNRGERWEPERTPNHPPAPSRGLFLQAFKGKETANSAGTHSRALLFRSEEETWRVFSPMPDRVLPVVYLVLPVHNASNTMLSTS